jgi:hypothetical protein
MLLLKPTPSGVSPNATVFVWPRLKMTTGETVDTAARAISLLTMPGHLPGSRVPRGDKRCCAPIKPSSTQVSTPMGSRGAACRDADQDDTDRAGAAAR